MNNDPIVYATLSLILIIVLFFLFRGINLWYWKITTILKYQEKQIKLLQSIAKSLTPPMPDERQEKRVAFTPPVKQEVEPWKCPTCHRLNKTNPSFCENCNEERIIS